MENKLIIKFAARNLSSHRLRSVLTISAMVIGISAIIFLVGFAFGIESLVSREITGANAYELIDIGTGDSQIVKIDSDALTKIKNIDNIKTVETIVNLASKVSYNGKQTETSFFGTSPNYMNWSGLEVRYGQNLSDPATTKDTGQIVVNTAAVRALGLSAPETAIGMPLRLTLIIPKDILGGNESKVVEDLNYKIVGVIKDDNSPSIYGNSAELDAYGVRVFSQAKAMIVSKGKVDVTRKQIEGLGFKTEYVGETIAQVQEVFNIFKTILGSFGIIALIVACLGMLNTLTISLLERTKEIALLKIIGTKQIYIIKIFLAESILIGIAGGILGILLGFIAGKIANSILNGFAVKAGGDSVLIFYYPIWFILLIFFFAVLVSLLIGLYPAKRAATINPLDVMRYE